ncbi:gliding motility-associated C-terminal domain-containing protein [Spirosoma montaniterrae]|uniref:Gliding motility-associated C-terminal domain-containing protein n=1 Tax=Spirosoma montaniterrae TaxID=1178516 RepID=A0A1P9WVR7_9BACT|nr:gliding motility-associated C-terminal domain-containing protein [Spirosoma montaniterrae]AQG79420.1 hypothetical protein AWR27_08855 [Spirosoma montaniterrae]
MRWSVGLIVCLSLWTSVRAFGQELIPNGGFETYATCPRKDNLLSEATPWYNPNTATPDFYHSCFPTPQMELPPHSGQGLARLFMDLGWAEYLATPLKEPLLAGETYQFELYVASPKPTQYPIGSFGAYFANQPVGSADKTLLRLDNPPQVLDNTPRRLTQRLKWEKMGGCLLAKGGERHVVIGNFAALPSTLGDYYLFIDDVSLKPIRLDLGRDTTLCGRRSTLLLDATTPGAIFYEWNTGSNAPTLQVAKPGRYWVTVQTPCKTLRDTITVTYPPDFSLGADTTLCEGKTLMLHVDAPGTYQWQDGSRRNTFLVERAGQYVVQVTNKNCMVADTIAVRYSRPPQLDLGADQQLCGTEVYTIRPTFANGTFRWLDAFADVERTVNASGIFRASVTNACATRTDDVLIDYSGCSCQVYAPDAFSPNTDGLNDVFEPFACNDITFLTLTVYDRWGEAVFHTDQPPFRWNGTYQGERCATAVYTWQLSYLFQRPDAPPIRQTKQKRLTLLSQ